MKKSRFKNLSAYLIAFLALAFVFLAFGLGTLGSAVSTGKSYELFTSSKEDENPNVVFRLSNPVSKKADGSTETTYLTLKHVYVNVGTLYGSAGKDVSIRLNRGTSSNSSSSSSSYQWTAMLENLTPAPVEEDKKSTAVKDAQFNWVAPFDEQIVKNSADGYKVQSYSYYRLTAPSNNILVNEIVFVGEKLTSSNGEGTGEFYVIPAQVYSATPYNHETNESAKRRAGALIDKQKMPNTAQSSFSRLSPEESAIMASIAEMRLGNTYAEKNVYHGDTVYNTLGTSVLALGTLIFGMSPFGLRFFPMLASFGVLVLGYFFAKALFKSEKAGFAFALVYALCNFSFGLGHLGTPLMLGVFFFVASLYACYSFYARGMKTAHVLSALPLIVSGLCGAAAICVNGAFLIPVLGVVGLFAAGIVRQRKARRYYLDLAIEEAEAEERALADRRGSRTEELPAPKGKEKVVAVLTEYRNKTAVAAASFATSLIVGALFFSLVFLVPMYYLAVKLFDNPASPQMNIFLLAAHYFAGGYTGGTAANAWTVPYTLFVGSGSVYAITAVVMNVVALLAGLCGIAFAIWRIVLVCTGKAEKSELRSLVVLLGALALSLVTTAFAQGGHAFLMLAYAFAFVLAGGAVKHFTEAEGKTAKIAKAVCITGIVLLGVCFLLAAVFTFSVPLPAAFMNRFV